MENVPNLKPENSVITGIGFNFTEYIEVVLTALLLELD